MPDDNSAMMGHNLPPTLDPAVIGDQLSIDHKAHVDRTAELLAGFDRFQANVPKIEDEETNERASDFVKQLVTTHKAVDAARDAAKRPYSVAADTVHAFFKKGMLDPLMAAADGVRKKMTDYAVEKRERARRDAIEEANRRRAEADRLAKEAEQTQAPEKFDKAIAADNAAMIANHRAGASSAELSRTRGTLGSVSSLRADWKYRVVDITKLPPHMLQVNDAMVKAHMKSKGEDGAPLPLDGIEFYIVEKVQVR